MKRWLTLFSLTCIGCNVWIKGTGDYQVYVDPQFDPAQAGFVKQAVKDWENKVSHKVTFHFTDDWHQEENLITISPTTIAELTTYSDHSDIGNKTALDDLGMTYFEGTSSLVEVSSDLTDHFSEVTRHELGHALGLEHQDGKVLMNPVSQDGTLDITCEDVQQFCQVWDCNPFKMKGCQ